MTAVAETSMTISECVEQCPLEKLGIVCRQTRSRAEHTCLVPTARMHLREAIVTQLFQVDDDRA
jgi:hypothetical protein